MYDIFIVTDLSILCFNVAAHYSVHILCHIHSMGCFSHISYIFFHTKILYRYQPRLGSVLNAGKKVVNQERVVS